MVLLRPRSAAPSDARANLESPLVPLSSATLLDWLGGPKVHSGVSVTEKSAMGMTAVWRAVNLLSGSIGSLPLDAYRRVPGGVPLPAGERAEATAFLANPHPDMTLYELLELVVTHIALWGNFYGLILRDEGGRLAELWPLHPSSVQTGRTKAGTKVYKIDGELIDGTQRARYDDTIFHIPGIGFDGITGVSPIRMARQGIGLGLAAEEYGARLWGSGSLASGILQTEQRLTTDQADALKERWKAKAGGLSKAHEVVVLDRGAKFEQLSIPPEDAQFIESRRFQVEEIARLYGIPPHMLGDVTKSTSWGTGIEQQSIGFVKYTLRPWLSRIEQRVTKHLLKQDTVYARFDVEDMLRGDAQARALYYKAMWEIGGLNTDEIRAKEGSAPVPGGGGKIHHRPLNYGVLGSDASPANPGGAPAPEPEPEPEPEPTGATG